MRMHFSFHYGTTGTNFRANGFPARDKAKHPAIIRIDKDAYGPHIHFHDEADHIPQSRIDGMIIEKVDPFDFVRAVLQHRKTNEDFDSIMKFKVTT
jgi:hypothetical protein